MAQGGASLLIYIITCLAILISYFFLFPQALQRRQNVTTPPVLRNILSTLVLLHTLFVLYNIIVLTPPNIFTRLDLPLATPTDAIRSLLLLKTREEEEELTLPRHIEQLLTRLGSFEMRTLYVRFGHDVVSSCEFCSTFNDFALYAFAGPFLSYIREIGLVGLVTLKGTRHERYRTFGVGVLIASILAEGYLINTAHIQIPQNDAAIAAAKSFWAPNGVFMLHDNLYLLRQLVFLLLPSVIHFLLPPSPSPFAFAATPVNANNSATPSPVPIPQTPHAAALLTLQALVPKLQLLRYTRGAVMRSPSLRDSATEWWSVEKQEGEWVRGDDAGVGSVREVARGLGVGFDERTKTGNANNTESAGIGERNMGREDGPGPGPLRVNARAATRNLMAMFTTGTGMGSNQGSSSTSSGNRR